MRNPSTYTVLAGSEPATPLYCEEDYVYIQDQGTDKERHFRSDGPEPYLTRFETVGQLYRACVRQHGRAIR